MSTSNDERDKTFAARIQSCIATVEAWDDDPSLLAECRLLIPFEELMREDSPYRQSDDPQSGDALLLKRLAVHFQKDVMTWVNAPPCPCGGNAVQKEIRGPVTAEEIEGQASRVEVYECPNGTTVQFPRYNSVRKLLETRRGRCGEYANLFGLYCRACGFETRYVSDWTDHVWVEVLVGGDEWVMADACEGIIGRPSLYEAGWGKKLNYIVGVSAVGVADVTPRYTRRLRTEDFQERRRRIATSEAASDAIIARFNDRLRQNQTTKAAQALARRDRLERSQLDAWKGTPEWTEDEKRGRGRISGSLEWRLARREAGDLRESSEPVAASRAPRGLYQEQMYPFHDKSTVRIEVSPQGGIAVSGVWCSTGQPDAVEVAVVDDVHLGCILQCRAFFAWRDVVAFVTTVPAGRIVALTGATTEDEVEARVAAQLRALGGFELPAKPAAGVLFLGRRGAPPAWTACSSHAERPNGAAVVFCSTPRGPTDLRAEPYTVPRRVTGRLPEAVLPLQTQLQANEQQKRAAFLAYAKDSARITGYVTKPSAPVYLTDNSSFPFRETPGEWTTHHYLPQVLVPSDGNENKTQVPSFDLPLEESFFQTLLGPTLLSKLGVGSSVVFPTTETLKHTRLVGLYFSAHWCPPCRRFTPMLAELYDLLRERRPYHGLEIVFVSSDRSQSDFSQYHATMPWAAVPFDQSRRQAIGARYGVQGIPALVILDALSGRIVASAEQARTEVSRACARGDAAVEELFAETWLGRLPTESVELFRLLELSAREAEEGNRGAQETVNTREAYLTAGAPQIDKKDGDTSAVRNLDHGVAGEADATAKDNIAASARNADIRAILATMLKYLDNTVREPWNPKFRQFKMSNKIVDEATSREGAIDLICSFGMTVAPTAEDFMVTIPLASNLDAMQSAMARAMEDNK